MKTTESGVGLGWERLKKLQNPQCFPPQLQNYEVYSSEVNQLIVFFPEDSKIVNISFFFPVGTKIISIAPLKYVTFLHCKICIVKFLDMLFYSNGCHKIYFL